MTMLTIVLPANTLAAPRCGCDVDVDVVKRQHSCIFTPLMLPTDTLSLSLPLINSSAL